MGFQELVVEFNQKRGSNIMLWTTAIGIYVLFDNVKYWGLNTETIFLSVLIGLTMATVGNVLYCLWNHDPSSKYYWRK